MQDRETALTSLSEELAKISAKSTYPVPTIRFIEEAKIATYMRQQSLVWDKSCLPEDGAWWGFQDHTFVEHFADWIEWYWKQAPKGMSLNMLSNRSQTETSLAPRYADRRHVKFWGEATSFLSTSWIIGDYIVMINTRSRPFYLVEIHDKLMAHDQREVFKNLWEMVP
jgi:hypothetical protein